MDDGGDQMEQLTLEPAGPSRARGRAVALWAVLAVGALAVGAVVVSSAGDDGEATPGLPVALGAARASGEAAADAMVAPVTYVAGADLPALGGEATAYRLSVEVTEAQVRALADALGLSGEVAHDGPSWTVDDGAGHLEVYDAGTGSWWYSASGGGAGVSSGASGSGAVDACSEQTGDVIVTCEVLTPPSTPTTSVPDCGASDGPAECLTGECDATDGPCAVAPSTSVECGPAVDCLAPTTTIECGPGADCAVPAPPPDCAVAPDGVDQCTGVDPPSPAADLPSEDEARAIALDLLAATGVDVDDAVVRVEGGFDAWYVTVEPRLDGVPSGLIDSVTVGSGGEVIMAGGTLAVPEPLGDYPLLTTGAAIDRANATVVTDLPAVASDVGSTADVGAVSTDTTMPSCKVQPDGREICETDAVSGSCENEAGDNATDEVPGCELPTCPQVVAPADEPLGAPDTTDCAPPVPDPGGVPAPVPDDGRIEVVLVDAAPALVVLPAIDGSDDGYLVPAYRFADEHGGVVDLPAVADSALTTPPTTDTSTVEPPVTDTVIEPQPCDEPLVEGDASGTTITVQPDPDCVAREPEPLAEGEQPEIGVGYYVDVAVSQHCEYVSLTVAGEPWWADGLDLTGWSTPTEGGTITFSDDAHAVFVGDHEKAKVAELRPYDGAGSGPVCS